MIPGTPARAVLDAQHGFRTNKAATRIKCLGPECGTIMDIDDQCGAPPAPGAARTVAESSHETFVGHLMEAMHPISELDDPLAEPPY
ncbi:hypothetical protein [Arthrobacter sp. A2-55]|uniref:hypothetical protein n=1 Tax=Arthrobacter sp. A2-55 TaxID=2897337 RepID=UPI0021CD95CD|nr:hypothetical protein [Arthrobacter sp. A2-55]MCU6480533.1 hypothetical protein [Arthrobacter sp. A2-55]